ncbi:GNAT family N-acetyltransferase [Microlunatus sp. GCM10028923]|uniref:GNAT family N-acetyltransferase n=1 Tax=Microlunatus sp. GCM10028923 TaxID=3273400 RepID=UPI00360A9FFA
MTLTRLDSAAALRSLDPEDPFLRWEIPATLARPGYVYGAAVIIPRMTQTRGDGSALFGTTEDAAVLVEELIKTGRLDELPRNILTIEEPCYAEVAERLELGPGGDWHWMWTADEPPEQAGEDKIIEVARPDWPELTILIDEHNPGSDGIPGRLPGQVWLGLRDRTGSLIACGVVEDNVAGYPLLSGITVDPAYRGRGLGRAITAALTRFAVRRQGVCTLGAYAANSVAIKLYESLGFRIGRRWRSRRLIGAR